MRTGARCGVVLAAALAGGLFALAAEGGPDFVHGEGRTLCVLANKAVNESSGVACSRVTPGVFWTHNDSGDGPNLYATNAKGENLGTFRVAGASARDWEDIASFTADGKSYLLIADVGDNAATYAEYRLYLVEEPRLNVAQAPSAAGDDAHPGAGAPQPKPELKVARTITFVYEDGPHNCEAVGVDPVTRTAYLVTKRAAPTCKVYALPLFAETGGRTATAKAVATLAIPAVVAMDILSDNRHAVVLTYGNAFEYVRRGDEPWPAAFAKAGRELKMPRRAQGESICYGADGRTLYLTSEGPCPLIEVPVKEVRAPATLPTRPSGPAPAAP